MSNDRLWNRKFVQLFCIETMLQFGLYLTRPLISSYAVSLGASLALAGFLAGLLAAAALAVRPVSGIISDRLSKKMLLVVSCILFALSAFGCAVFQSIPLMAVFLSLQGFAFAFKSTIVVSLASLVAPKSKIGSGVGWLGLAYTVACAFGPALGSFIGAVLGYAGAFAVSGALLAVGLVLAVFFEAPVGAGTHVGASKSELLREERRPARWSLGKLKECFYGPTLVLSTIAGLLMVAQGVTSSFILLVGDMRSIEGASFYFLFYSIATLASRPLAGAFSDKWGVKAVAPPMMFVAASGMIFAALIDSLAGIVLAGICMGVGQGSAYCAIQSESVRNVPEDHVGRAANTFYLGPDLGMGIGPILGGFILQSAGVSAMFAFNAFAAIAALILFEVYVMRRCLLRKTSE